MNQQLSLRERIRLNLVAAMEKAGLNQVQLADRLGISKGTVNNWIRGNNSPDVDVVPRICEVLNIQILELYSPTAFESGHPVPLNSKIAPSLSDEAVQVGRAFDAASEKDKATVRVVLSLSTASEPPKEYVFASAAKGKGRHEVTLTEEDLESARVAGKNILEMQK